MTPIKTNQGSLKQRTPTFLEPGTWFLVEETFPQTAGGVGGRARDDSMCTLFLLL